MIIWNNYEYGKKIYEEKSVRTKKWQYKELKTLVLYMLLNDKTTKEIRESLEECCQEDIKYLREKQKKAIFNKIITQTKQNLPKKAEIIKENYIKSREIIIYIDEVDKIKALNNKYMEQTAFVLLVYCKWLNNLKWFGISKSDIFREAKINNLNAVDQQSLLSSLLNMGYLKSDVMKVDRKHCRGIKDMKQQMWSLTYLSQGGDVAFTISDYYNFVYRYMNYVYCGYFMCEGCGKIFKQNKQNNLTYCKRCAKDINLVQTKDKYQPIETKTIVCVDCGSELKVDSKDNQTRRCDGCYKKYISKINSEKYRISHPDEFKTIICIDCGCDFTVPSKDNQTDRCPECYKKYRAEKSREKALRYYRKHK